MKYPLLCAGMMLGVAGCGFQHSPLWDKPPLSLRAAGSRSFGTAMRYAAARLTVDASGRVVGVTLLRANASGGVPLSPEERAKVEQGYRQYCFRPAEIRGKPIASELILHTHIDDYD